MLMETLAATGFQTSGSKRIHRVMASIPSDSNTGGWLGLTCRELRAMTLDKQQAKIHQTQISTKSKPAWTVDGPRKFLSYTRQRHYTRLTLPGRRPHGFFLSCTRRLFHSSSSSSAIFCLIIGEHSMIGAYMLMMMDLMSIVVAQSRLFHKFGTADNQQESSTDS